LLSDALDAEQGDCPMRVLEQLANFRVRLAVQRWRLARHQTPTKREEARLDGVQDIETALTELDTLCQRRRTPERLCLKGSAFKRLAMLESDAKKQIGALRQMADCYYEAFQQRATAYAFTNWLAATLLASQRGAAPAPDAAGVAQQLAQFHGALSRRLADDPNFWDAASLGDLSLSQLLLQATPSPQRRAKLPAGVVAAPVLAAYRAAIDRASSPRVLDTLIENLDFLITLWSTRDKATLHVLQQLRDSLS